MNEPKITRSEVRIRIRDAPEQLPLPELIGVFVSATLVIGPDDLDGCQRRRFYVSACELRGAFGQKVEMKKERDEAAAALARFDQALPQLKEAVLCFIQADVEVVSGEQFLEVTELATVETKELVGV